MALDVQIFTTIEDLLINIDFKAEYILGLQKIN